MSGSDRADRSLRQLLQAARWPIDCSAVSRFNEPQHPDFVRMNTSVGFDRRLWPQDIAQSRAHAAMLAAQGIISAEDRDALLRRPRPGTARSWSRAALCSWPSDEDIHMAIERHLTELVGSVGGKLHTARSRNDQVATDLLCIPGSARARRSAGGGAADGGLVGARRRALGLAFARLHPPAARPARLSGHHLLAYFWMLARDRERFAFAERQCWTPAAGRGRAGGVNFDTDRRMVAAELGFQEPAPNSIDAVANRDFALDYLECRLHLRHAPLAPGGGARVVVVSEFGFCELPDAWSAGSSIMPQKKNPDAAELLRAKAPRVVCSPGGLPRGDARAAADLQQGPARGQGAPVRRRRHARAGARRPPTGWSPASKFNRERLADAAGDELIAATDVADLLVKRGLPFREAHGVVAGLVRVAVDSGRRLSELTSEELRAQASCSFAPEASEALLAGEPTEAAQRGYYEVLARDSWLESKVSEGGTALPRVREQLELARTVLERRVVVDGTPRELRGGSRARIARLRESPA